MQTTYIIFNFKCTNFSSKKIYILIFKCGKKVNFSKSNIQLMKYFRNEHSQNKFKKNVKTFPSSSLETLYYPLFKQKKTVMYHKNHTHMKLKQVINECYCVLLGVWSLQDISSPYFTSQAHWSQDQPGEYSYHICLLIKCDPWYITLN